MKDRKQLHDGDGGLAVVPDGAATLVVAKEQVAEVPPMPEGPTEAFVNWVVRKIIAAREYKFHVEAYAAAEVRRAEAEEQYFWEKYAPQLRAWTQQQIAANKGKRKSIRLPAGTIGFRIEPTHLDIADPPAALAWCLEHLPSAVRLAVDISGEQAAAFRAWQQTHCPDAEVGERLLKSVLTEHAKETGELPPGATICAGQERFYVK